MIVLCLIGTGFAENKTDFPGEGDIKLHPGEEGLVIFWDLTKRIEHLTVMYSNAQKSWLVWELYIYYPEEGEWKVLREPKLEKVPAEMRKRLEEVRRHILLPIAEYR